jgi:hypothetical protein
LVLLLQCFQQTLLILYCQVFRDYQLVLLLLLLLCLLQARSVL